MQTDKLKNLIPVIAIFVVVTVTIFTVGKANLFWPLFYIPVFIAALTFFEAGGLLTSILATIIIFTALYVRPPVEGADFYELLFEFSAAGIVMIGTGLFVGWMARRQQKKLSYYRDTSMIDKLTACHNYGYFWERLEEERKRADRFGSRVALMMVDIDKFKDFNDRFGHATGNLMLQKMARLVDESVRDVDIVCRYGSEEFVVILPNTEQEAERVAERVRTSIEKAGFEGDKDDPVVKGTVSVGVAIYPTHCENEMELIDKADLALAKAKKEGRNKVVVYEP
jgi:diguanylate cyclase (GGDEF)-like protein